MIKPHLQASIHILGGRRALALHSKVLGDFNENIV